MDELIPQLLLYLAMGAGAAITAVWVGITLWTYRDMRARSRDSLAQIAATVLVALLNVFGLIVYLMLRPRETLSEAYERSLEEEALLQSIEEKPVCPGCGRPAHAQWQVCPHCYTRLKKPCVHCGQLLDLGWNVCPYCATQQAKTAPDQRGQRSRRSSAQVAPPARQIEESYESAPPEEVASDE
ncbi:MAG: zinc ribbon domain-containing protein [Anaerolineae bacterium]|nr:zinc ribbon domain-containing protein [Anaerolineae bacterium]